MASMFVVLNGLGGIALLACILGVLVRREIGALSQNLAAGAMFGLFSSSAILDSNAFWTMSAIDPRIMVLGFAAAFLGAAGLLAAYAVAGIVLFSAAQQLPLALIETTGATLAAAGAMGMVWARMYRWHSAPGPAAHVLLGCLVALGALTPSALKRGFFGSGDPVESVVTILLAVFFAIVMGAMVQRERSQALREASLTKAALIDPVCSVANRSGLADAFATREDVWPIRGLAFFRIDIGSLQPVIDRHGNEHANSILRSVAATLLEDVEKKGCVARLEGNDFGILLAGLGQTQAELRAERLRGILDAALADLGDGLSLTGVTIGGAWARRPVGLNDLMKAADLALYAAKHGSAGKVLFREISTREPAAPVRKRTFFARSKRRGELTA